MYRLWFLITYFGQFIRREDFEINTLVAVIIMLIVKEIHVILMGFPSCENDVNNQEKLLVCIIFGT